MVLYPVVGVDAGAKTPSDALGGVRDAWISVGAYVAQTVLWNL